MSPKKMSKSNASKFEKLKNNVSVIALLVSILSLIISLALSLWAIFYSREANLISSHSLEMSKQANEIALGRYQIYPSVEIGNSTNLDWQELLIASDLDSTDFTFHVINNGTVVVDQVVVEIIGIPGLLSSNEPQIQDSEFIVRSEKVIIDLDEFLLPSGILYIDLKSPIINYLIQAIEKSKNSETVYLASLNFVVSARQAGDSLPIQNPENLGPSRMIITLKISEEFLASENVRNILGEEIEIRIMP